MALTGTSTLALVRTESGRTRSTFLVGEYATEGLTHAVSEAEALSCSVFIDVAANDVLLHIERAALRRARDLLAAQLKAVQSAIEAYGEE